MGVLEHIPWGWGQKTDLSKILQVVTHFATTSNNQLSQEQVCSCGLWLDSIDYKKLLRNLLVSGNQCPPVNSFFPVQHKVNTEIRICYLEIPTTIWDSNSMSVESKHRTSGWYFAYRLFKFYFSSNS